MHLRSYIESAIDCKFFTRTGWTSCELCWPGFNWLNESRNISNVAHQFGAGRAVWTCTFLAGAIRSVTSAVLVDLGRSELFLGHVLLIRCSLLERVSRQHGMYIVSECVRQYFVQSTSSYFSRYNNATCVPVRRPISRRANLTKYNHFTPCVRDGCRILGSNIHDCTQRKNFVAVTYPA